MGSIPKSSAAAYETWDTRRAVAFIADSLN
jgi:hypothetical protein